MSTDRHEQGLRIRREVMGEEFVERAMRNTSEFTAPLQEYLNENCWGTAWVREELPRKVRSLITIAMLSALKCPQELKGHVRGALRNGCTPAEIREVLLHAAVYCGAPAAVDAFRAAREVIEATE